MNKIERIIIQRTAITDEKLLSEIMHQLGEFPDMPSPCKALTRQICKETQLRGNGGTIILLLSRPNPHLSFVPNKSPEELEGPFPPRNLLGLMARPSKLNSRISKITTKS